MDRENLRQLAVGDVLCLKKPHPCGCHEWLIMRVGADFRLECQKCRHQIMLPRSEIEKRTVKIIQKAARQ